MLVLYLVSPNGFSKVKVIIGIGLIVLIVLIGRLSFQNELRANKQTFLKRANQNFRNSKKKFFSDTAPIH